MIEDLAAQKTDAVPSPTRSRGRRTCVLHIGTPKAGSATIQGFLDESRGALAERGIDVPDFGLGDIVRGPIELGGAIQKETDFHRPQSSVWRWLDERIAATDSDVCVSRESLCQRFAHKQEFAFVRGFFRSRGMRVTMLVYLREHPDFINAAYTQAATKLRATQEFDDWLDGNFGRIPQRFSYWKMLRHVIAGSGVDLFVTPLHEVAGERLIQNLCARLGVFDLDVGAAAQGRDQSPGPREIAAGVLIGRILADRRIDARANPVFAMEFRRLVAERGWTDPPFYGFDPVSAERVRALYAEENDKLASALGWSDWSRRVPPSNRERNRLDLAYMTAEARADVDDLVKDFLSRTKKPLWRRLAGLA